MNRVPWREKKKIIWNAVFSQHNPFETEQLTEGLDEMNDSGAELWANTELRAGNSSAQEPHSVPTSCQSSTAALSARETRDTRDRRMCSFSPNNPTSDTTSDDTLTHSTLFLFPSGKKPLTAACLFFGVLVFVLQGCSKFSFFKLSILNAIVYSRI